MENSGQSTWVHVLGEMETGVGLTHLNSILVQRWKSLAWTSGCSLTLENSLGKKCISTLHACSMQQVAEEEKQHAIATNSFHQGVPSITVVVDGGWSKWTHKHSYNAKSGLAVIFGSHIRRLLFIGVCNKFCAVCAVSENKGNDAPQHSTDATATGQSAQQPWKVTSLQTVCLKRCTDCVTCQSLMMVTVQWWRQFDSPSSALRYIRQEDWMGQSCLQGIPKLTWGTCLRQPTVPW